MRVIGGFLLVVGIAIAGWRTLLLSTGEVPEADAGRVDTWFHLAAGVGTAAVALVRADSRGVTVDPAPVPGRSSDRVGPR